MAQDPNIDLFVATYDDPETAQSDYEALKAAEGPAGIAVIGAVIMSRDADGNVDVLSKGGAAEAGGAVLGGGLGLIVGLFAPPLLAATAIGAGIGGLLGHLTKKHEEKKLGVELDEYFPPDSSAIVVIIDDVYLDGVEKALGKSVKRVSKAIDKGDYDDLKKALEKSDKDIGEALDS